MKAMKMVTDPKAFQLLADETRRKMVFLLRVKEMTVSQIAAELNLTPQAVYHHIKKLQTADLVEVVREERLGHLIESYYRTTADSFYLSMGKTPLRAGSRKVAIEQTKSALNALQKLGFKMVYTDDQAAQLVDLRAKMEDEERAKKCEEAISKLDLDFATNILVADYTEILSVTDDEFEKNLNTAKKMRELLLSLVKK
jgi:predicted transcriptional regulator